MCQYINIKYGINVLLELHKILYLHIVFSFIRWGYMEYWSIFAV